MYKSKVIPYLFILPFMLFAGIFLLYPFCRNIVDSFLQYSDMLDKTGDWVGFQNYLNLFQYKYFQYALLNTFYLIILVILFQVGIALILALLVSLIKRCATFFKVSFFMPIVISATAIGLMFTLFYDYNYGALNQIRTLVFGLDKYLWLDPSKTFQVFVLVCIPVVWQYIGFYFVIFMAGLANISDEILEASEIDGCNRFQQLYLIKIPMLRNVLSTVIVLAITGTLKVFDLPFLIAKDGFPAGENHFLGTLMHSFGFANNDIGMAAAFAVVMVLLGVVLSAIVNRVFKQVDYL